MAYKKVYTYDYPVYTYEDNSVYLVLYRNGKKIHEYKDETARTLAAELEATENQEDKQDILSYYDLY